MDPEALAASVDAAPERKSNPGRIHRGGVRSCKILSVYFLIERRLTGGPIAMVALLPRKTRHARSWPQEIDEFDSSEATLE